MKHFQKIIIYLVYFTISFVFIQTDILSQSDSLLKNDSLIIGGLFKITLTTGEETVSEIKSYDSISIKVTSNGSIIGIKRNKIKTIEEYTYILRLGMGKKYKEKVTLTLKDGTFYQGRLLSVLPIRKNKLNEKDDMIIKNNILEIERDKIFRVFIHGNYNALTGLGYGALIGTCLGGFIGYTSKESPEMSAEGKALVAGLIVGFVGGVVGVTVGFISSTPDEVIVIDSDDDYDQLKNYIGLPFNDLSNYPNQKKYKEEK